jgi:hypothetical protein
MTMEEEEIRKLILAAARYGWAAGKAGKSMEEVVTWVEKRAKEVGL